MATCPPGGSEVIETDSALSFLICCRRHNLAHTSQLDLEPGKLAKDGALRSGFRSAELRPRGPSAAPPRDDRSTNPQPLQRLALPPGLQSHSSRSGSTAA